jgi:hypothetical protein
LTKNRTKVPTSGIGATLTAMTEGGMAEPRLSMRRSRVESMAPRGSWQRATSVEIRATVLAGIWLGALVGGVGGRLAMLVLRLSSPDSVHGVISDDGFLIGQVTLKGTYGLIGVGAAIGIIGAVTYRWVDHWLIGPGWFKQVTSALGAGAVVGSMLVHRDGVDFRVLRPPGLAIAFFVLIPAVFGFFIGPLEKVLAQPDRWVNRGRRGWLLPLLSVLAIPPMVIVAAFVAAFMLAWAAIRQSPSYVSIRDNLVVGLVIRGLWLTMAILGLESLVDDARAILP